MISVPGGTTVRPHRDSYTNVSPLSLLWGGAPASPSFRLADFPARRLHSKFSGFKTGGSVPHQRIAIPTAPKGEAHLAEVGAGEEKAVDQSSRSLVSVQAVRFGAGLRPDPLTSFQATSYQIPQNHTKKHSAAVDTLL
jgi:hypothetical protein